MNRTVRLNREIKGLYNIKNKVWEVRLLGSDGEAVGIVDVREALRTSEDEGLDLVEVDPNTEPPICRVLDYSKYLYLKKKKQQASKLQQKKMELHEIKMTPNIDSHDFETKTRQVREFLEDGDSVRVSVKFVGRQITHQGHGKHRLDELSRILTESGLAIIESEPRLDGKQMFVLYKSTRK